MSDDERVARTQITETKCMVCDNLVEGNRNNCGFCGSRQIAIIKLVAPEGHAIKPKKKMTVIKASYLYKQGGAHKTWHQRYFVLTNKGALGYYKNEHIDHKQLGELLGKVKVSGATVQTHQHGTVREREGYLFSVTPKIDEKKNEDGTERTYFIEAATRALRDEWIAALTEYGCTQIAEAALPRLSPSSVREGYLKKKGGIRRNWKDRFWVLHSDRLDYYDGHTEEKVLGSVRLTRDSLLFCSDPDLSDIDDSKPHHNWIFSVSARDGERKYVLSARDKVERDEWVASVSALCGGIKIRREDVLAHKRPTSRSVGKNEEED